MRQGGRQCRRGSSSSSSSLFSPLRFLLFLLDAEPKLGRERRGRVRGLRCEIWGGCWCVGKGLCRRLLGRQLLLLLLLLLFFSQPLQSSQSFRFNSRLHIILGGR